MDKPTEERIRNGIKYFRGIKTGEWNGKVYLRLCILLNLMEEHMGGKIEEGQVSIEEAGDILVK